MSTPKRISTKGDIKSKCKNHPNSVCYCCGLFSPMNSSQSIYTSPSFQIAYKDYFGFSVSHQDKNWVPHFVCNSCYAKLVNWRKGKNNAGLKFGVPVRWREPRCHLSECYFCLINFAGLKETSQANSWYNQRWPPTVSKPILHSVDFPVPPPPPSVANSGEDTQGHYHSMGDDNDDNSDEENFEKVELQDSDYDAVPSKQAKVPTPIQLITPAMLNDLAREMRRTPIKDLEILASRLSEFGFFAPETRVTSFRGRYQRYSKYYAMDGGICFCTDLEGLFDELGVELHESEWRLFIDAGKDTLKAVLLHNQNKQPTIPLAYSRQPENRASLVRIMELIGYGTFDKNWLIVSDLKVVAILRGIKSGNVSWPCFLCRWSGTRRADHWSHDPTDIEWRQEGDPLEELTYGVIAAPLAPKENFLFPVLHIKLGLCSQFIKALVKHHPNCAALKRLVELFEGQMSFARIKGANFQGPNIRKMRNDLQFTECLRQVPGAFKAWNSFEAVCDNFLGNHRAPNYKEIVQEMLNAFRDLGCNMSLKVHMLYAHLDLFAEHLGKLSEESGERFHQDISPFEERFKSSNDHCNMIGDYLWCSVRETDPTSYRRLTAQRLYFKK